MSSKKKKKLSRKTKKTALVICRDRNHFWTTQQQFWQWLRDGIIVKTQDKPLTGAFIRKHEESMVSINHTILNIANKNHVGEVLNSKKYAIRRCRIKLASA